jgi:hypothetical protein
MQTSRVSRLERLRQTQGNLVAKDVAVVPVIIANI